MNYKIGRVWGGRGGRLYFDNHMPHINAYLVNFPSYGGNLGSKLFPQTSEISPDLGKFLLNIRVFVQANYFLLNQYTKRHFFQVMKH